MIVYYYGGTSPTNRALEARYSMHMYAAQGYVVYTLNPSGTTGFGQEFSARHVNAWGKVTADEIIKGTETFCQEHPFVDAKKIGCIGASYGGFMTQYLQTRTDLFAAAISHAGISALSSYWGEGYWGYGYCAVANAGSYPWNNAELFTKQSPLFNADKSRLPTPFTRKCRYQRACRRKYTNVRCIETAWKNRRVYSGRWRKSWNCWLQQTNWMAELHICLVCKIPAG
jgi:Dipeptidyl aminopeptidases/acylaminoacyl-peptidases